MARLRLFGPLASVAGVRESDVEGATVGECLDRASERFGPSFAQLLGSCRVAVGERTLDLGPASAEPVAPDTEIVLLPPVGGGAHPPES